MVTPFTLHSKPDCMLKVFIENRLIRGLDLFVIYICFLCLFGIFPFVLGFLEFLQILLLRMLFVSDFVVFFIVIFRVFGFRFFDLLRISFWVIPVLFHCNGEPSLYGRIEVVLVFRHSLSKHTLLT